MPLIVFGMHHSGASMVARIVQMMGACAGPPETRTGSNSEAPQALGERKDIRALHDDALHAADWQHVAGFDVARVPAAEKIRFQSKAQPILAELNAHRPWVIEDPRLCLLFPLWRPLLDRPVCILVHRHPLEVAQSLKTRRGFPITVGIALWEKYHLGMLSGSEGLPQMLVAHHDLMADPVAEAQRIYAALVDFGVEGLRLPDPAAISDLVDPALHREPGDLQAQSELLTPPQQRLDAMLNDRSALGLHPIPPCSAGAEEVLHAFEATARLSADIKALSRWMEEIARLADHGFRSRYWAWAQRGASVYQTIRRRPMRLMAGVRRIEAVLKKYRTWGAAPATTRRVGPLRSNLAAGRHVTIIVAVYNAYDEVAACLDSVLRNTTAPYDLLVIDDGSPDPGIRPLLASYANRDPHIRIIENEQNLGYTATINRGCTLATEANDIVLLNSDTEVTPGWLEKLSAAAASAPKVATVTPLSNAAGAFSVPKNNTVNPIPAHLSIDAMGRWVESLSERRYPRVPTGNGFCLYITRDALDAVGLFDVEHFPRGYGEENDFCLRASAQGFVHLIDDATFIYHKRSASFGEQKAAILAKSMATLNRLHPEYRRQVRAWLANDPLDSFRQTLEDAIASGLQPPDETPPTPESASSAILYVVHAGEGGTLFTNEDLMSEVVKARDGLLLKTALGRWGLYRVQPGFLMPLKDYPFETEWRAHLPLNEERLRALRDICATHRIALVHIRHLLASGPELIVAFKEMGIPIVFSFHDFYTLCPTVQLLDEQGRFCAGRCTDGKGVCPTPSNWIYDLPTLKHQYIYPWRERIGEALRLCDACVTTSHSAHDLLVSHYPFLKDRFRIIEHGRDVTGYRFCSAPPKQDAIHVVAFGGLTPSKGSALIEGLLRINRQRRGPLVIHLLGNRSSGLDPATYGGVDHGPYERDDLPGLLEKIAPSFSLVASRWPETYCHTLTESWAAGIPVLATRIGALQERVEKQGGGWLIDSTEAQDWYDRMLEIAKTPADYEGRIAEIRAMRFKTVQKMAEEYQGLYLDVLARRLNTY